MMRSFIGVTVLAATTLGLAGCSAPDSAEGNKAEGDKANTVGQADAVTALVLEEGQKQVRVSISGMTCPHGCPVAVRALLEGVPGVAEVGEVDYENSAVDCAVDDGQFDAIRVADVFAGTPFEGSAVQN